MPSRLAKLFGRTRQEPVFTGNCFVRQFTGDGYFVGRCYHSTRDHVCPVHGNVEQYLLYAGWPRDFELPMYDDSAWAIDLRKKWANR